MTKNPIFHTGLIILGGIIALLMLSLMLYLPTIIGIPAVIFTAGKILIEGKKAYYDRELHTAEKRMCWLYAVPIFFVVWLIRDLLFGK